MSQTTEATRYGSYPHKFKTVPFRRDSRWSSVTEDDGTYTVTVFRGWGIVTEARFSGDDADRHAHAFAMSVV